MQVTKELLENDIKGAEIQLEQLKAQTAQVVGALGVLKNILEYLGKEPMSKEDEERANQPVRPEVNKPKANPDKDKAKKSNG